MANVRNTILTVQGKQIPAKIYRENRNNVRASVGKKSVILRMPSWMDKADRLKQMDWFENWIEKTFKKSPDLFKWFYSRQYVDGDTLTVGAHEYNLRIRPSRRESHYAKKVGKTILLEIKEDDQPANKQKAIRHLLSRVVGRDQKPFVSKRVHELNATHFQQNIKSINLKYNLTNWGSCSSTGNLNLSTRLLFAPQEVIDYVIIHELAHLIELNHSDRFWALVERADPGYKASEKWLKLYGEKCNF